MKKSEYCYVTRDTVGCKVRVWPAEVGIRKFHGCVEYGAAYNEAFRSGWKGNKKLYDYISTKECKKRFGFTPDKEKAYDIDGSRKQQIKEVILEFSD